MSHFLKEILNLFDFPITYRVLIVLHRKYRGVKILLLYFGNISVHYVQRKMLYLILQDNTLSGTKLNGQIYVFIPRIQVQLEYEY